MAPSLLPPKPDLERDQDGMVDLVRREVVQTYEYEYIMVLTGLEKEGLRKLL